MTDKINSGKERVVLEYQLQNRVENLADVSTRCSGLLRPEEGQSIWLKRRQGFQPCFEAGIRELPFLMLEPAEKPSLQIAESFASQKNGTRKIVLLGSLEVFVKISTPLVNCFL